MSPRPKPKPTPAQVETPRRGHAPLKYNREMAEQFGITPASDAPEPEWREFVKADSLPDPPADAPVDTPESRARNRKQVPEATSIDDAVLNIIKEEAGELAVRLERYGIQFTSAMQQDMADHTMALLTGLVGGGALARR
jgi:hypothetical protein